MQVDSDKPVRLRLLDLPFTAVEWVQPAEVLTSHMTSADDIASWHQQPHTPQHPATAGDSWQHPATAGDGGTAARGAGDSCGRSSGGAAPPVPPVITAAEGGGGSSGTGSSSNSGGAGGVGEERMAFTLGDGRAGVLSVCGRAVADARAKRPVSSSGQVGACACAGAYAPAAPPPLLPLLLLVGLLLLLLLLLLGQCLCRPRPTLACACPFWCLHD